MVFVTEIVSATFKKCLFFVKYLTIKLFILQELFWTQENKGVKLLSPTLTGWFAHTDFSIMCLLIFMNAISNQIQLTKSRENCFWVDLWQEISRTNQKKMRMFCMINWELVWCEKVALQVESELCYLSVRMEQYLGARVASCFGLQLGPIVWVEHFF